MPLIGNAIKLITSGTKEKKSKSSKGGSFSSRGISQQKADIITGLFWYDKSVSEQKPKNGDGTFALIFIQ